MSKAIFISTDTFKAYTIINGNQDDDNLLQWIEVAQDVHIHQYLGTDLYNAIQEMITDGSIGDGGNASYKELLDDYIKPALVRWALVEYLPFASYDINRGGVLKHNSETADSVSIEEINSLIEKTRYTAMDYTKLMINYLCNNSSDFPEYSTNSNGDLSPTRDQNPGGWVM